MSRNFFAFLVLALFVFAIPAYASAQSSGDRKSSDSSSSKLNNSPQKKTSHKHKSKSKNQKETELSDEENFALTVMRIGEAYQKKQLASALVYCEQAMDKIPASVLNDEKDKVISLYMVCFELYDKNEQHEKALDLANMIRRMTDDINVHNSLCFSEATTLTKLHRWQAARDKYAECPGYDNPQMRAVIKSNVAELYMIEGDCVSAAEAYRESLKIESTNPHAVYGLAVALSRLDQWDEARKVFLSGVEIDPNFKYLDDAFFVPDCENDYQTAFRMYELGRFKEAWFYLERYVKAEERAGYRQHAQRFMERIASEDVKLEGAWPVLLHSVTAMAVDTSGQKFGFASLERDSFGEFRTDIYLLDGVENKIEKRAQLAKQKIMSASYIPNGGVRFLGPLMRYELFPEKFGGYYQYSNDKSCFPLTLMPDGEKFLCVRDDGMLVHVPWNDPYRQSDLLVIPNGTKQVMTDARFSSAVVQTTVMMLQTGIEEKDFHLMMSPVFDVRSMAVHPTKKIYALGIQSGTVLVDEKGRVAAIFGSPQPAERVAFDPSGKHLAVLSAQTVEVWRVPELDGE